MKAHVQGNNGSGKESIKFDLAKLIPSITGAQQIEVSGLDSGQDPKHCRSYNLHWHNHIFRGLTGKTWDAYRFEATDASQGGKNHPNQESEQPLTPTRNLTEDTVATPSVDMNDPDFDADKLHMPELAAQLEQLDKLEELQKKDIRQHIVRMLRSQMEA